MNEKKTLTPLFVEIVRFDENDVIATSNLLSALFSNLTKDNIVEINGPQWKWE